MYTTLIVNRQLDRLRAGDLKALDEMIRLAQGRLEMLAHRALLRFPRVHRFNETSDILQAASVRLWQALRSVTPNDARHFFALASQHIRWELLSLQEKLNQAGPLAANHATQAGQADSSAVSPIDNAANGDPLSNWADRQAVLEAIAKLPVALRELVDLYIIQELPRAEVANLLDVSERQVNRLWVEARLQLGKMLNA
jgi:RNA polymerase sigma factor (sigma-70 family)